jgi:uncharacterized cupredoxin-like copper-binding protein
MTRTDSGVFMLALALALSAGPVHAQGGHDDAHADSITSAPASSEAKAFGRPGDPKSVSRTVMVDMSDIACATPGDLALRLGDTVRFVVKNSGKEEHEMLIGTLRDLKEHAESVETDADVAHDEPYMTHVAPGRTEAIVWHFTRVGIFYYGCHVPGLPGPGVIGRITVFR